MKRLLLVSLTVWFAAFFSFAQEEQPQYLFDSFQAGQVYYKDGRVFNVDVNFSLVSNKFVFIDAFDNDLIKEFADVGSVGVVKVGERIFVLDNKGGSEEVMQSENPRILVQYKGKIRDRGQKAAYGGRSQTSAIESISSFQQGGMLYRLEGDDRWIVQGVSKRYRVEKDRKMRMFSNEKQFLKIYSKQKAKLQAYIKDKKIDFDNVDSIVGLCLYADGLE